nr:MAG TPA: ribosome, girodazole, girolline, antibiotic complex, 50S [Caudoviricetes sp.]
MERVTQKDECGYYLVGDGIYGDWGTPEKFRGDDVDRLAAIEGILGDEYDLDRLRELVQADREGRCVVLNMPRKPLVWGDDDQNACLCPYCGRDLMGIPYGERMVLQCPECGQYLDVTKIITRAEAEAALREDTDEH